jgi:hypothetical protein
LILDGKRLEKLLFCFFIIAQISKINPNKTTSGASTILRKLKSSSPLNTFGSSEPPPTINRKPIMMITNPTVR